MAAAPQRYLFDVSFDAPDPVAAKEPMPAHYSRADVDAARTEGFDAGRAEALAAAADAIEQHVAAALAAIDRGIAQMLEARDAQAHQVQAEAVAILRTVLQKAVPALCRKDPLAELEAMVSGCLAELLDEPRLVLRVSDALFDAIQQRISALAQAGGYAGKIVLLADEALADGDGRIEWADGGAERDTRRIAQDIDACLARALAAPAPRPPAEETTNG
jgi:flagellar assembly protein FliH